MPTVEPPKKKKRPKVTDLDTQVTLLIHPEENPTHYEPFVDAKTYAFDPAPDRLTRVNAWWLAEAAWLSYGHSNDDIKTVYKTQTGLQAELVTASSGTQGTDFTIATNGTFAIVAFRGTQPDEWDDIFSDVNWFPKPWDVGHVHAGFAEAFEGAWQKELKDRLDRLPAGCAVWFTGHSLGAAIATLAAQRVKKPAGICTFGSPLVGNQVFSGEFNMKFGNLSRRYVNDFDLVTRVPPDRILFPFIGHYTHVDVLRWIDRDGNIGETATSPPAFFLDVFGDPKIVLQLMKKSRDLGLPSLPNALQDHTPLYYVIHVWNDFVAHFLD
jgi:hypothetical protein